MQQNTKKDVRERAKAARRAAQLRKEAEDRAEAQAKLDGDDQGPESFEASNVGAALLAMVDAAPTTSTPKRRKRHEAYSFSAEDIEALRTDQRLSWRQIAVNLDLGGPSAARAAYTALTGKPHSEAGGATRQRKSTAKGAPERKKVLAPKWNDDADQDEVIDKVTNARLLVHRSLRGMEWDEEIHTAHVQRLSWDGAEEHLCVHFVDRDTGGTRSVLVSDIKEVR